MNSYQKTEAELLQKYEALVSLFRSHAEDGICIAYSGGVDSTLLLKAAVDAVSKTDAVPASDPCIPSEKTCAPPASSLPVLAVILETQLHPHSDTEQAYQTALTLGAAPFILPADEFQNPEILKNPVNRCYLCKHLLFSMLKSYAQEKGYRAVFDGTNKDDEKEYRPGMRVLKELNIQSPLQTLGLTKADVRTISALLGLSTASVPSTPCLATRLPYNTYLDRELLQRIHAGETHLREMGFYNVRLRYHAPVLRLELDTDAFSLLISKREEIIKELKSLGFSYITLDLEGFRSGSMDIGLK